MINLVEDSILEAILENVLEPASDIISGSEVILRCNLISVDADNRWKMWFVVTLDDVVIYDGPVIHTAIVVYKGCTQALAAKG